MKDDAIEGKTRMIFIDHFISYVYTVAISLLFPQYVATAKYVWSPYVCFSRCQYLKH